jgi:hypothetical protein
LDEREPPLPTSEVDAFPPDLAFPDAAFPDMIKVVVGGGKR